jgi:hypothetical protein
MSLYQRKRTTGVISIDRALDDIYHILNHLNQSGGGGGGSSSGQWIITDIGGLACIVQNLSGGVIPAGYLVKASPASTLRAVTLANENDFDIAGVAYKEIPAYALGYIVVSGPCDVYFNSNGSFAGGYYQMSRDDSTGNDDTGKAHCGSVAEPDIISVLGYVFQARSVEGLARCILKR